MKKLFALILAACLLALAACGATEKAENTPDASEMTVGGWQVPESPEITEEIAPFLDKAMSDYDSGEYEAQALIGTQVVAGMNYRFLGTKTEDCGTCNKNITFCVITVYKDLQGNAKVTDITDTDNYPGYCESEECWYKPASPVVTEEVKAAFDKAAKDTSLVPVALVGSKDDAGENYMLFCKDGDSYSFATLNVGPDGKSQITETKPLSPVD